MWSVPTKTRQIRAVSPRTACIRPYIRVRRAGEAAVFWPGKKKSSSTNLISLTPTTPRERASWYQAVAYCRWLSDKLGERIELPHENEWEAAARWDGKKADGRIYPWGDEFDPEKANTDEGGAGQTTAVGIYPAGKNKALNLDDLSGNVWEWCRNKYDNPDDEAIDQSGAWRVLRGGSWFFNLHGARAAYRHDDRPGGRLNFLGARVARRVVPHLK